MKNNNIEEKIKKIISSKFSRFKKIINNNTSFKKDLESDSLDIIEIIMEIENVFKIEILDDDVEKLDNINSILEYVNIKLKNKK